MGINNSEYYSLIIKAKKHPKKQDFVLMVDE